MSEKNINSYFLQSQTNNEKTGFFNQDILD